MNRHILITGASGEIGSAIARRLAREDRQLILHGFRNRQGLEQLQRELEAKGCRAEIWLYDFSRLSEDALAAESLLNRVDILIHVSGHALYKMLIDTTEEEWDRLFQVHVKSAFLLCKRVLPYMVRMRWGRIILLSSLWGEAGASCESAYAAAKGALNAFARSLAQEYAPSGITVNAVAPGAIETKMVTGQLTAEELEELTRQIPLGRLGSPDDVASLVEFLTRDEAGYITGQILHVNGGWR